MTVVARLKARSAGGSIIATVPKKVVEALGLRSGDEVVAVFSKSTGIYDELLGKYPGNGSWDRSWTRGRDRF